METEIYREDKKPIPPQDHSSQGIITVVASRRFIKIPSCVVNLDDLKKLYSILEPTVREAADLEFNNLKDEIANKNPENLSNLEKYLKEIYKLSVEIESLGDSGEYIIGHSADIFDNTIIPDEIGLVRFQSGAYYKYKENNRDPNNFFIIQFDFSNFAPLAPLNPSFQPTPNNSYIKINGKNGTWVSGIYDKFNNFLNNKRRKRNWLHTTYIYDILLFTIGFPISFWVVYKINKTLKVINWPIALEVAFYVYIVLFCLRAFLFLFGYTRWLFPLVEFEGTHKNISKAHRLFFSAIGIGVITAISYDIIKILFF